MAVLGHVCNQAAIPPESRRHRDRTALSQLRDTEECAVTTEVKKHDHRPPERIRERVRRPDELGSLEVWARSAPIRLAGYEEDLAEPHILQGVD
ncbi:hypothetical protein GCM10010232_34420 [Streptomyces amakusaensis]